MTDPMIGELSDMLNGLHVPNRLWQGRVSSPAFGQPLLVQFEGTDETGLSPELRQSLNTFLEQAEHYKILALSALFGFYQRDILPLWQENNAFGVPELASTIVPNVQNLTEFEALLTQPRLWLHSKNSWGLEFECTWDVEHGAGVLFLAGQVMGAGLAEAAH